MSELISKQIQHTENIVKLILYARSKSYLPVISEQGLISVRKGHRVFDNGLISNETFQYLDRVHAAKSLHYLKLASDILLFEYKEVQINNNNQMTHVLIKDGMSKAYKDLGAYWKDLHSDNAWGGDFTDAKGRPGLDGNHFSTAYGGMK